MEQVGVLATAIVALAVALLESRARRRADVDRQFLEAFDLLTGGTQRRSAGISLLEGLLGKKDNFRWKAAMVNARWRLPTIRVLESQAIYLVEESDQGDRSDEVVNLDRIIALLTSYRKQGELVTLAQALERRLRDERRSTDKKKNPNTVRVELGLSVGKEELNEWLQRLRQPVMA